MHSPRPRPPDRLRVGTVAYLVGRPLDLGLDAEPSIELVHDVPASLVKKLRAGELDVALCSSIELFRASDYRYVPDLAVAGRGRVGSVQLFLRQPLDRVRSIALDPASRTAATLVRVLFAARAGALGLAPDPEFVEGRDGVSPRWIDADAWLEIGDAALRTSLAPDAPPVFNPSAAWSELTGLPFVFAAWIARPGAPVTRAHLEAFARARERGRAALGSLAARASEEWNLPRDACARYLGEECVYEPGADFERALFEFRDRAAALDLCRADLDPRPIAIECEHVP